MHTPDALLDMLARTHWSVKGLIAHCRTLSAEELNRELPGFGYPTVRLQLHHALSGQRYWIGVLEGRMDVDEDADDYADCDALETYRQKMEALTERYLKAVAPAALNAASPFTVWGGKTKELTPAHVVLRTLMHFYQHQGQVAAMCRTMGKPLPPGLDFPLGDVEA